MVKYINSLKNGTVIGLDANIFLYVTTANPKYQMTCKNLLNRVYRGELIGITSVIILDEVLYKTMIFEVMERHRIGWRSAVDTVKTEPEVMRDLKKPKEILDAIIRIGIEIMPFDLNLIVSAEAICRRYLLRSHDAILVATLEENKVFNVATNDSDFERVDFLNVRKP